MDERDPPAKDPGTVDLKRSGSKLSIRRFTLRVTSGPDSGVLFTSRTDNTRIGTHGSADFVLRDPTVSRFHCEIVATDGAVTLRDLGSRNGTFIDGVRVVEAFLRAGSVIVLGQTHLAYDVGEDRIPVSVSDRERFGSLVGRSVEMRKVFAMLERAAQTNATVLLEGETGTGKEAAAEALHRESQRKDGPFVVVDCGAIPPELLESELFGHEKGAFTGAVARRVGAFEAAHGGTIFIDEVGELGGDLQPKLLRALERREIKRVGSTSYQHVDVRVVAATNRNLRGEVNARRFRSDLYYRLAVVEICLPALRDRIEDIPLLVDVLVQGLEDAGADSQLVKQPEFLASLARHAWPGNVRELRNYVERCLALSAESPLQSLDSAEHSHRNGEPRVDVGQPIKRARETWIAYFERRYLSEILARHNGNVSAAARAAEIDRIHFYRLLWRHGLK